MLRYPALLLVLTFTGALFTQDPSTDHEHLCKKVKVESFNFMLLPRDISIDILSYCAEGAEGSWDKEFSALMCTNKAIQGLIPEAQKRALKRAFPSASPAPLIDLYRNLDKVCIQVIKKHRRPLGYFYEKSNERGSIHALIADSFDKKINRLMHFNYHYFANDLEAIHAAYADLTGTTVKLLFAWGVDGSDLLFRALCNKT